MNQMSGLALAALAVAVGEVEAGRDDDVEALVDVRLDERLVVGVGAFGTTTGGVFGADRDRAADGAGVGELVEVLVVDRADVGDDADLEVGRRRDRRRRADGAVPTRRRRRRRVDAAVDGAALTAPSRRRCCYRQRPRWTAPRTGSVRYCGCACVLLQVQDRIVRGGLLTRDRFGQGCGRPSRPTVGAHPSDPRASGSKRDHARSAGSDGAAGALERGLPCPADGPPTNDPIERG